MSGFATCAVTRALTAGAGAAVVVGLAHASGGYFPSEWGLLILGFALVLLAVAVTSDRIALGRLDLLLLGSIAGLAAWQLLSVLWSSGPDAPVLEAERTLVYLAALSALLVSLRRELVPALLTGMVAGVVAVVTGALVEALLDGRIGDPAELISGIRLDEPLGYANAVGILSALAGLIAAALALRSGRTGAALTGAVLVPLASALAFTFSRGAVIALGAGALVLVALEWERGRAFAGLLVLGLAPGAAALVSVRSPLADSATLPAVGDAAGTRLLWQLALLAAVGALAGLAVGRVAGALAPYTIALAGLAALAAVVAVVVAGPRSLADDALDRFRAEPAVTGSDVPGRLLSLSSSSRTAYWTVAWGMVERDPLLGEGAGSYERWWLQERPVPSYARDAHNLYLETLAELGPLGLALLLLALATPVLTLRRRVRHPATPAAGAAYAAFLVHAALDWDWEIPAVTLVGLACGGSLLVLARPAERERLWTPRLRAVVVVGSALLAGIALVAHVGNRAAAASEDGLDRGDVASAVRDGERARTWQPWAAGPQLLLGEAEAARGRLAAARRRLREALDRDPESWRAWYALVGAATGREQAAALRRVAELNPLLPRAGAAEQP